MPKFSLDYNRLDKTVNKTSYKLSEVKDRLEKVAFDIVKFKDSDDLWQVQSADDGEYIVAKYESVDEPNKVAEASTRSSWDVSVNTSTISVFYKNRPIAKFAASKLGLAPDELDTVKRFLPNKLATDKNFVKALLNEIDSETRQELTKLYPELLK